MIGVYTYPTDDIYNVNTNLSSITLFYVGDSNNKIKILSRIREYHAANCSTDDNLVFLSSYLYIPKEISATNDGSCQLAVIMPLSKVDNMAYFLYFDGGLLESENGSQISIFTGYNKSDELVKFNYIKKDIVDHTPLNGILISFIIPPNIWW
uniref:Uncharacterized protein n=1 Tax=Acrobeloides nanus TaxID=290746 RepID=A0A914BVD9_9BILA